MKAIDRLSVIRHKSKINEDWKHKELFRLLHKDDIWLTAYKNVKSINHTLRLENKNNTFDKINLKKLKKEIITNVYKFKIIPCIKTLNFYEKIALAEWLNTDKIVYEVICIILRSIYTSSTYKQNTIFFKTSPETLDFKYIETRFCSLNWVVQTDNENLCRNIVPKHFCRILNLKIQDPRFINLIYKLLKSDLFQQSLLNNSISIVTKNNFQPSIFVNIYYTELDKWVQRKSEHLNQPCRNQKFQNYQQLSYEINRLLKHTQQLGQNPKISGSILKKLKAFETKIINISKLKTKRIRIEYIRYYSNWIIGVQGNRIFVKQLKKELSNFIYLNLEKKGKPVKINSFELIRSRINFLNYELFFQQNQRKYTDYTVSEKSKLLFYVPIMSLLEALEKIGYIKKLLNSYRSISKIDLTTCDDFIIVKHFKDVWNRILYYYLKCNNFLKLQYIHYLLYISCAMTLSHRHRSSIKKIFSMYGKNLTIYRDKTKVKFSPKLNIFFDKNFESKQNQRTNKF